LPKNRKNCIIVQNNPGSSNGRTAAFEAVNLGSNPSLGASDLPVREVGGIKKNTDLLLRFAQAKKEK
jgi:hypothetical protein